MLRCEGCPRSRDCGVFFFQRAKPFSHCGGIHLHCDASKIIRFQINSHRETTDFHREPIFFHRVKAKFHRDVAIFHGFPSIPQRGASILHRGGLFCRKSARNRPRLPGSFDPTEKGGEFRNGISNKTSLISQKTSMSDPSTTSSESTPPVALSEVDLSGPANPRQSPWSSPVTALAI